MEIIMYILKIIEYLIYFYLAITAAYIFIFALAGIFPYKQKMQQKVKHRRIAVLIPGYKEDAVIVEVAKDALNQNYPKDQFEVIIIADHFQENTLDHLKALDIKLIEVQFKKSTKAKALNKAMETIGNNYDIAVVLDADNLMEEDFLNKVNQSFEQGFHVVQGHRVAKNMNNSMAILDAISEEVNNSIFRKGHRVLGLSSALIGSGMAFDYRFFKETMAGVDAIGGFDKELEMKLLRDKNKIEYLEDAIVLDEKVQKSDAFANQRRRWLSAQFIYFRQYLGSGLAHLFMKGNIDFFDKVFQMIQLPRVLLLGLLTFLTITQFVLMALGVNTFTTPNQWLVIFILTYLAFFLAIPGKFYTFATLKAILNLPKAFFVMFLSLFKLKGANKKFIHTAHGTNS